MAFNERFTMRDASINTFCMIMMLAGTLSGAPAMAQTNDEHIVWSQTSEDRYSLELSSKHNNQWSPPEMIEESENPIIVPTLSAKQDGDIVAAWTELDGNKGRIRYKIKRNGAWESSQELMTATSSDMAPASVIDSFGILWLCGPVQMKPVMISIFPVGSMIIGKHRNESTTEMNGPTSYLPSRLTAGIE